MSKIGLLRIFLLQFNFFGYFAYLQTLPYQNRIVTILNSQKINYSKKTRRITQCRALLSLHQWLFHLIHFTILTNCNFEKIKLKCHIKIQQISISILTVNNIWEFIEKGIYGSMCKMQTVQCLLYIVEGELICDPFQQNQEQVLFFIN